MHKGMFTEEELRYLRSLDAVERAEPLRITYSKEFKREFMRRYHEGESDLDPAFRTPRLIVK